MILFFCVCVCETELLGGSVGLVGVRRGGEDRRERMRKRKKREGP